MGKSSDWSKDKKPTFVFLNNTAGQPAVNLLLYSAEAYETDMNFLWICIKPRETIREITQKNHWLALSLLAWLLGAGHVMRLSPYLLADKFSLALVLGIVIGLGLVIGHVSLYFFSYLCTTTARWLGGNASTANMRMAVAFSRFPDLVPAFVWLYFLLRAKGTLAWTPSEWLTYGFTWFVFWLWSLRISIETVGEVNHFSGTRSFFALVLGNLVMIFIVMILSFVLVTNVPGLAVKIHLLRVKYPNWTSFYSVGPPDPDVVKFYKSSSAYQPKSRLSEVMEQNIEEFILSKQTVRMTLENGRVSEGTILEHDAQQIVFETLDQSIQTLQKESLSKIEAVNIGVKHRQ